jgi:UDP:flavonoid glycosyltransferase YjiC (YdhE family)
MIVVAGPRIDPESLRHLAACDLAVVQGGLTTAMELTAGGRPFLYRLDRYGAGRRMDFDTATPDLIAAAIAEEIGREVDYREVESDGARRAAADWG